MSADCQDCRDLRQKALTASKVYYKLLEDLEAAYICHDSEVVIISTRMAAAFQSRNWGDDQAREYMCEQQSSGSAAVEQTPERLVSRLSLPMLKWTHHPVWWWLFPMDRRFSALILAEGYQLNHLVSLK